MPIRTQQDIDSDRRILKTEEAIYAIPFEADDLVFALVDDHALPPSDSDLDANLDTVSAIHKALASVPGTTPGEHLIVLGKLLMRLGNRCVIAERTQNQTTEITDKDKNVVDILHRIAAGEAVTHAELDTVADDLERLEG